MVEKCGNRFQVPREKYGDFQHRRDGGNASFYPREPQDHGGRDIFDGSIYNLGMINELAPPPFSVAGRTLTSRLIVGTGKYSTYDLMRDCLEASGADVITVAVRRDRLVDSAGRNILDFIDLNRYTILPNTAGCFEASEAVRVARLGREILEGLGNPGANWVKIEVLDSTAPGPTQSGFPQACHSPPPPP